MALGVLKIFGTKVSYFTMLYELKMNVFIHLSVRVAEILSVGLSDRYTVIP